MKHAAVESSNVPLVIMPEVSPSVVWHAEASTC